MKLLNEMMRVDLYTVDVYNIIMGFIKGGQEALDALLSTLALAFHLPGAEETLAELKNAEEERKKLADEYALDLDKERERLGL